MSDPLTDAANAISGTSPKIRQFAQLAAARIIALEKPVPPPPPPPPPPPAAHRYYADNAWCNLQTPANVPHDPNSAQLVALLVKDCQPTGGLYANGLPPWSTTFYHSRDATTTKTLRIHNNGKTLSIPWNPAWVTSPDSDAHITIIDDATGITTAFQGFETAESGGAGNAWGVTIAPNTDGRNPSGPNVGNDGGVGGVPQLAGLILPEEWNAGAIGHATKGATQSTSAATVWPATRSDGNHSPGIPFGARFALPRDLNLAQFNLSPAQLKVAQAWQTYCHCIADTGGGCSCAFQSTAQPGVSFAGVSGPFVVPSAVVAQMFVIDPRWQG